MLALATSNWRILPLTSVQTPSAASKNMRVGTVRKAIGFAGSFYGEEGKEIVPLSKEANRAVKM